MPFQKFGTGDGRVLQPEPDEAEQMQRTASRIENDRAHQKIMEQREHLDDDES